MRLGILTSHPIQYQAPWFRGLAKVVDLEVFFAHRQSAAEQGKAGFGVAFDWDVDLLSGYNHRFLKNVSARPGVNHFSGCDTPEIREIISGKQKAESRNQRTERESGDFNFQLSAFSVSPFDAFIVTGWHLKSYWQAVRACRRAGVPVLVRGDSQLHTPRSWLKRLAKEIAYRILLRQFDGFLTVGKRNREYLAHYGVPERKMFFVPHFVDNEWFAARAAEARGPSSDLPAPNSYLPTSISHLPPPLPGGEVSNPSPISALRSEWGADEQTLVALFVGKFQPIKRPADLLRAMVKLRVASASHRNAGFSRQNSDARATLLPHECGVPDRKFMAVFVGSGELGDQLRNSCQVLFDAENPNSHPPSSISHLPSSTLARPRATFAGFKNQSELPRYYTAANVLVLPSESETWGLVVNEAMACGLPAIVSDAVGCAPDLIEEGKTGFTFPLGDDAALAERLATLAKMKLEGHDFAPALAAKMRAYSLEAAVSGTLQGVRALVNRKHTK